MTGTGGHCHPAGTGPREGQGTETASVHREASGDSSAPAALLTALGHFVPDKHPEFLFLS